MNLLFGSDDFVAQWIAVRVGADVTKSKAIGVVDGNRLIAGVVYSNFRGCDIEMLCASESARWLSKSRLYSFFAYPFVQLGCLRATAIVAKKNKHSRQFIEKIGFKLEGTHPRALDGRDACSYGMLRTNCKWIKDDGKKIRAVTARTA